MCPLQRMKAIQPNGAVRLCGYSYGACVAIEMALQLQQQGTGDGVESLVLVDGSQFFSSAYVDHVGQRSRESVDNTSLETAAICSFVNQLLRHFAHSNEVCYYIHLYSPTYGRQH